MDEKTLVKKIIMDTNRKCQICRIEYLIKEYYTKNVYICRKCNTLIANLSRFKKIIKSEGMLYASNLIINERLMLDAKESILGDCSINNAVRILIEKRGGKNDYKK